MSLTVMLFIAWMAVVAVAAVKFEAALELFERLTGKR